MGQLLHPIVLKDQIDSIDGRFVTDPNHRDSFIIRPNKKDVLCKLKTLFYLFIFFSFYRYDKI
jgi:hypothetical protein